MFATGPEDLTHLMSMLMLCLIVMVNLGMFEATLFSVLFIVMVILQCLGVAGCSAGE